jgi:polysaccharide pyruvyl transferase WcaK-like protein
MVIELRGVEFINKGAELMMHAIIEKIRQKYPKAIITMQIGAKTPKVKLTQNGIKVKFSNQRSNNIGVLIPSFLRHMAGYYLEKEVDVILDGSGFAFGDQWGSTYAERRIGSHICNWRSQGKKIILLPQAFGPFKTAEIKQVMEKIIYNADLIFARESESFQYLQGIATNDNIIQSPDFTNLIKGKLPKGFDQKKYGVAIIPNYKMVESKSTNQDVYLNFLKHAINKTISLGLKPFFLIHEGIKDQELAKIVNTQLSDSLEIVIKEDPLEIKGIISASKFIICSRFHGVVSALSQGVPCVVTSWSHKYVMLLKEYNFEEGLMNDLTDYKKLDTLICDLSLPDYRQQVSEKLLQNSNLQKEKSAHMWEKVYQLIDQL